MKVDITALTLNELYALRTEINNHLTQVETQAKLALDKGEEVQGYQLKDGVNRRYITDERAFTKAYHEAGGDVAKLYETKLKGIVQLTKLMEEALDKEMVNALLTDHMGTKQTQPTLIFTGMIDE